MMPHIDLIWLYKWYHNNCKLPGATRGGNNIAYIHNVSAGISMTSSLLVIQWIVNIHT